MADRPEVTVQVQAIPGVFDPENTPDAIQVVDSERWLEDIRSFCKDTCVLGSEACHAEVLLGQVQSSESSLSLTALCIPDRPNPLNLVGAAQLALDLASGSTGYDLADIGNNGPEAKNETTDFFHLVENAERGKLHAIPIESLRMLRPNDHGTLTTKTLNVLERYLLKDEQYSRVMFDSDELKAILGSDNRLFLVGEGMTALLGSSYIRFLGKGCRELVEEVQRKAIDSGIEQEALPAAASQDILIEDIPGLNWEIEVILNDLGVNKIEDLKHISEDQFSQVAESSRPYVKHCIGLLRVRFRHVLEPDSK